jgi:glycosyltransferase involved in cell wall biosynthesis
MKILMIGPGQGKPGGILALTEALVPVLEQEVSLVYFPTVKRFSNDDMGKLSLLNLVLALFQYVRFLRTLWHFQPQIVHLHTSQGLGWLKDTFYIWASKLSRCRLILHVHAAEYDALYGQQNRFIKAYTRYMMLSAEVVIAVSEEWRKALAEIVPIERIFVFKPCLAVDSYAPQTAVRNTNGTTKALFLGTIGPRKGAFDLLEAMSHLKSENIALHLSIAGGEERKGDLTQARSRLNDLQLAQSCQLVGTVQGEKKTSLLNEAIVFVLPSYNEGLPFAIIEAMAAGMAIVSTPVGGIPEVIKDGYNGFLVPPGDVPALAEKLSLLAANRDLCQLMGQRNRQIAEQELDVKPYASRLSALYESLLAKPVSV